MRPSQNKNSQARNTGVVNHGGGRNGGGRNGGGRNGGGRNGGGSGGASKGAESARRVIDLLLAFNKDRHTLSVRELADTTGIPVPSVYRYVALLRGAGLLVGDNQRTYHLSTRFSALARAAEVAESIIGIAHPTMRELVDRTGETVLLSRLINGEPVCVHRIESSQRLRSSFDPGEPLPLERSATSRILMASMTPERRQAVFAQVRARSAELAEALERNVSLAIRQGFATAEEELDQGIWAASAGVRGAEGELCAALTLTAPLVRTPRETQDQLLDLVRAGAREISALLGLHSS